jgi:hypothetical protein
LGQRAIHGAESSRLLRQSFDAVHGLTRQLVWER